MNNVLSRTLFAIPLFIHVSYFIATADTLPSIIGYENSFTPNLTQFIYQWSATILFANIILFVLNFKMSSFSDKVLSVPGKEFWFKNKENRTRLIYKLKELLDTILILLNILFLAVYQLIYQSNMATPVIRIPQNMLITAFIITPFLGIILIIIITVIRLYKHK